MTKTPTTTPTDTSPAALTGQVTALCVKVTRAQASNDRGKPTQWTVSAWTTGGTARHATVSLAAAPAGSGKPSFSFGCGSGNGSPSCDLGTLDAQSTPRQLQARLTVPVTAAKVTSVRLIASGNASGLATAPTASATVVIMAPPRAVKSTAPRTSPTQHAPRTLHAQPVVPAAPPPNPVTITSPLPVGNLPSIPPLGPIGNPATENPATANAAGLFPTLAPAPTATAGRKPVSRPVANTSALPEGAPIADAQVAGLAALALAFVLAITRLSIRRKPATSAPEATDQPPDQSGTTGQSPAAGTGADDQGTKK